MATSADSNAAYHLQNDGKEKLSSTRGKSKSPRTPIQTDFCFESWDDEEANYENYYIAQRQHTRMKEDANLSEEDKEIIQRLSLRRFHLPGNSYWQDWKQFILNNHLILGFMFADERHPFGTTERAVMLVASFAFGLAATSMVVLWYFYEERDMNKVAFILLGKMEISYGTLSLLTMGAGFHAIFDLSIWYVQACPLCRPGGLLANHISERAQKVWVWIGVHTAAELAVLSFGLAIYVMFLRASVEEDDNDNGISTKIENYRFVLLYFIEVVFTQVVMFPIVAFTLFNGPLGCGRIPIIGGRPSELRRREKKRKKASAMEGIVLTRSMGTF